MGRLTGVKVGYKLTAVDEWVVKIEDDGAVSPSFANKGEIGKKMWTEYQQWLSEGNEPEPEFTPAELEARAIEEEVYQRAASNQESKQFLTDTDWKVMRHIRQKAIGIKTSLTEEEYLALETERQQKAESIT